MPVSVVIPVWNGAALLADCLQAIYAAPDPNLLEVICVDNGSVDGSAEMIAMRFPRVHLVRQPVNLGFAGGVNVGIAYARGDVFVLLNQDCVVQSGWLAALTQALDTHPEFGILGCTILNGDDTVNHAGALIRRPSGEGAHRTDPSRGEPFPVDYATGAALAIRRAVWDVIGEFDEGFYPAYFEDADYCHRARRKGIGVGCAPNARVKHLFSNREWQRDTLKYWANQHAARYRFVSKHFTLEEMVAFFGAERAALAPTENSDHLIGRALAARDTLKGLPDIMARRRIDLGEQFSSAQRRVLQVGFAQLLRDTLDAAWQQTQPPPGNERAQWIANLDERERALLAHLRELSPLEKDVSAGARLARLLRRSFAVVSGRELRLLTDLLAIEIERREQFAQVDRRQRELIAKLAQYDYR